MRRIREEGSLHYDGGGDKMYHVICEISARRFSVKEFDQFDVI